MCNWFTAKSQYVVDLVLLTFFSHKELDESVSEEKDSSTDVILPPINIVYYLLTFLFNGS